MNTGNLRAVVKLLIFIVLIISYLLVTTLNNLIVRDYKYRVSIASKLSSFFSKISLVVMGFRIKSHSFNSEIFKNQNFLIVSNHISYMDEFIISSISSGNPLPDLKDFKDLPKVFYLGPAKGSKKHLKRKTGKKKIELEKRYRLMEKRVE